MGLNAIQLCSTPKSFTGYVLFTNNRVDDIREHAEAVVRGASFYVYTDLIHVIY